MLLPEHSLEERRPRRHPLWSCHPPLLLPPLKHLPLKHLPMQNPLLEHLLQHLLSQQPAPPPQLIPA